MSSVRDPVLVEIDAGIATITLNRPEAFNTIDVATAQALLRGVDAIEDEKDARVILLKGAGRGFCAGGDITKFTGAESHGDVADRTMRSFHAAVLKLSRSRLPSVAAVHGAVAGAGIGLMLACDFILAADDTRFSLAYPKIGATIDGGASWFLPRLVGVRKAKQLAILNEPFGAQEAREMGIVTSSVAAGSLEEEAFELAQRLAQGPTAAFGQIKRLIDIASTTSLSAHLDAEREAFAQVAGSEDFAEGLDAFRAKRNPDFSGR